MNKTLRRFLIYFSIGAGTFLFDLGLLYLGTTILGIPYYYSTGISFMVAINLNYLLSLTFVFKGSERKIHLGYTYFLCIAICGALATTGLVVAFVMYLKLTYLLARVIVAGIIGIANYLFNLHINFKVAGKHL